MTRPSSRSDPLAGAVLDGRYRVDEQIGAGGMCVVYRGFDQRLERPVAVKFAAGQFLRDAGAAERFDFEARATARLSDPGLVAVFDQGQFGGRPYLVLELVAGGTARALLEERGAMPPYAASALLEPVLRALGSAHRIGLVHGDVKPENVLISHEGDVKIADFGAAAWSQRDGARQSPSAAFGTAAYLAPEQVRGTPGEGLSAASDVYAAGVMLYELLTGALPFAGSSPAEAAEARLRQDVPPPSRAVDGVPLQFDHLVLRATEREPAARYPDATSMLCDLDRARSEMGLPPYEVPAPTEGAGTAPPALPAYGPSAQHTTVDLAAVVPAAEADPGAEPPGARADGGPLARTVCWRHLALGFVIVLLMGVAAVILGWDAAAILEHQLV